MVLLQCAFSRSSDIMRIAGEQANACLSVPCAPILFIEDWTLQFRVKTLRTCACLWQWHYLQHHSQDKHEARVNGINAAAAATAFSTLIENREMNAKNGKLQNWTSRHSIYMQDYMAIENRCIRFYLEWLCRGCIDSSLCTSSKWKCINVQTVYDV